MTEAPRPATDRIVIVDVADLADFAPLTFTRPVFGLRCGIGTLLDNQVRMLRPAHVTLWVRPALSPVAAKLAVGVRVRFGVACDVNEPVGPAGATIVDGRSWWPAPPAPMSSEFAEAAGDGTIVRQRTDTAGLTFDRWVAREDRRADDAARVESTARLLLRPWSIVSHNPAALATDAAWFARAAGRFDAPAGVQVINPDLVLVARGARVEPGVVLDGSAGPVCVDEGALVGANSVLRGPCYVGRGATLFPLTRVAAGANIGPACKVGGELGNAVFHGFANKAHDGFVGDSYVGEWVNLGAGTITSNLKNTYGPVRAATARGREETGSQFLGTVFGDHAKCGIGTMLDAGTYLGVGSQVAAIKPPQFVRSFRFATRDGDEPLDFDKLTATAALVAARRKVDWTDEDTALLREARALAASTERAP